MTSLIKMQVAFREPMVELIDSNLGLLLNQILESNITLGQKCQLISDELFSFLKLIPIDKSNTLRFIDFLKTFNQIIDISLHSGLMRNIILRFIVQFCSNVEFEVVPPVLIEILNYFKTCKSYLNELDLGYIKAIKMMLDNKYE